MLNKGCRYDVNECTRQIAYGGCATCRYHGRDPDRIAPMISMLSRYWYAHPDLRLGQIASILGGNSDPFYVEDDEMKKRLQKMLKGGDKNDVR